MVPRVGLEPTPLSRLDFESSTATDYVTEACQHYMGHLAAFGATGGCHTTAELQEKVHPL